MKLLYRKLQSLLLLLTQPPPFLPPPTILVTYPKLAQMLHILILPPLVTAWTSLAAMTAPITHLPLPTPLSLP